MRQFPSPYLYAGNGFNPIIGVDPDGKQLSDVHNATGHVREIQELNKQIAKADAAGDYQLMLELEQQKQALVSKVGGDLGKAGTKSAKNLFGGPVGAAKSFGIDYLRTRYADVEQKVVDWFKNLFADSKDATPATAEPSADDEASKYWENVKQDPDYVYEPSKSN